MKIKLFKIPAGIHNYLMCHFSPGFEFDIVSILIASYDICKLRLTTDSGKTVKYKNNEFIDTKYFTEHDNNQLRFVSPKNTANILITTNCDCVLEFTYEKHEYWSSSPFDNIYNEFINKCVTKHYKKLLPKKGNSLYMDKSIISKLKYHYSDVEIMKHMNGLAIDCYSKYVKVNKRTYVSGFADMLVGLEIDSKEQTVCNFGDSDTPFLSFNVKKGKHYYDVFLMPRFMWNTSPIQFNCDQEVTIRYKWMFFPYNLNHIIMRNPILFHFDMYTPDILIMSFAGMQMSTWNEARINGMWNVLCPMMIGLNDDGSNLQLLNKDVVYVILCSLRGLLF